MPNLKRPVGLIIKRGRWNELCTRCKRGIVKKRIKKDLELFLCQNCKDIYLGKRSKSPLGILSCIKRLTCDTCGNKFSSHILDRTSCYICRP